MCEHVRNVSCMRRRRVSQSTLTETHTQWRAELTVDCGYGVTPLLGTCTQGEDVRPVRRQES